MRYSCNCFLRDWTLRRLPTDTRATDVWPKGHFTDRSFDLQDIDRPLFDIDLWNVHDRVENNLPRTNNYIEGWDDACDQRVGVTHRTIRRLVTKNRKDQANNELLLEQISAGISVGPSKKIYQTLNLRLKAI